MWDARGREFKKGTDTIRINISMNISMNIDISMRFTAKVALADTHARLPKMSGYRMIGLGIETGIESETLQRFLARNAE